MRSDEKERADARPYVPDLGLKRCHARAKHTYPITKICVRKVVLRHVEARRDGVSTYGSFDSMEIGDRGPGPAAMVRFGVARDLRQWSDSDLDGADAQTLWGASCWASGGAQTSCGSCCSSCASYWAPGFSCSIVAEEHGLDGADAQTLWAASCWASGGAQTSCGSFCASRASYWAPGFFCSFGAEEHGRQAQSASHGQGASG